MEVANILINSCMSCCGKAITDFVDEEDFGHGWATDLYDCCKDSANRWMTLCCPCVTMGRNVEVIEEGAISCVVGGLIFTALSFLCLGCVYSGRYRRKMGQKYNLSFPCNDYIVQCFCSYCAICQEYRELKHRGLDPSIGWKKADEEKMKTHADAVSVAPDAALGMTR